MTKQTLGSARICSSVLVADMEIDGLGFAGVGGDGATVSSRDDETKEPPAAGREDYFRSQTPGIFASGVDLLRLRSNTDGMS